MNCERHPDRKGVTSIYSGAHDWQRVYLCKECSDKLHPFGRAYATGLGPEAAAEQRELKSMQEEESAGRLEYTIISRGKPK